MNAGREIPLLQRLQVAALERPKLYHATRIVLGVRPGLPRDGGRVTRWWSGVDSASGWEEFLGSQTRVFEAHEYERRSRWQQSCYYGDAAWMNEYTRLAAEAWGALPLSFAVPVDFRGTLHTDRDVWTFFLYRAALNGGAAFGLDIHGVPPYADCVFPGLEAIVACTKSDRDAEEPMLDRFREEFEVGTGRLPGFVYATLRLDVFSASVLGLRNLFERQDKLHGSSDALRSFGLAPEGDPDLGTAVTADRVDGERQRRKKPKRGKNDDRNRWIYDQRRHGTKLSVIRERLQAKAKDQGPGGWNPLDNVQGVQQAADSYAKKHGLPLARKGDSDEG